MQFEIEGQEIDTISEITYSQSLDSPCGSFSAVVNLNSNFLGKKCRFNLGDNWYHCTVEAVNGTLGKESTRCQISGRDQTSLILDCAMDEKSYPGKKNFVKIIQETLKIYDVHLIDSMSNPMWVNDYTVSTGELVYESIERALRVHKAILKPVNGKFIELCSLENKNTSKIDDVMEISISGDITERYGKYTVESDNIELFHDGNSVSYTAIDSDINKRKVKKIKLATNAKIAEVKARAEWERDIRKLRSNTVTITVGNDKFPDLGSTVIVDSVRLQGKYLLRGFTFQQSKDMKKIELECVEIA